MPWGIAAGAVASIAGAAISGSAASSAAQDQENASLNAQQIQQQEFNTVQGETAAQRGVGTQSSNLLSGLLANKPGAYANFDNSPGYKFTLQQSDQALNRQAASGGNLYSTNTLANLGALNAGIASNQYNNYINQLMTAAGLGNAATSTSAGAGMNAANNEGAAAIYGGNAAANGAIGQGQAINNGIGGLTNPYSGLLSAYGSGSGSGSPTGLVNGYAPNYSTYQGPMLGAGSTSLDELPLGD